jgi:hypothetical protein
MSNASIRRLIGGLGTALIMLICAVVIGAHFLTGRSLQRIDVSEYAVVKSDGADGYTAELDVDRLITMERLHNPTETEKALYPEIAAIKGLALRVTPKGDGFELETVTAGTDPTALLRKNGLRLINTKWTMSKAEMAAAAGEQAAESKDLTFSNYVRTARGENGAYTAALDYQSLFRDAGVDPTADPNTNRAAKALRSLDVICQKTENGYRIQTASTLPTVKEDLMTAGIRLMHTQWTWTEAEMEAHLGTATPLEAPVTAAPETPVPETPAPETSETPAPETSALATPSGTDHDVPDTTPETSAAPARNTDAIDSLYGFDQTEVRKAIRAAKEQKYGAKIDASEILYNCFAVGNDQTAHGNVFRIVYKITLSSGSEYLVADVYDLESETGYKADDVKLTVETSRTAAKNTDDLKDYKLYTLEGGSMVFPENKDKSPFDKDGLVKAKSLSESLSYDELWDIPATEEMTLLKLLGYARNEMFARGGHKFSDTSNYYKYFKQFSWYKPTGKVTADDLAKMYPSTKKNITTIKFLETLIKEG